MMRASSTDTTVRAQPGRSPSARSQRGFSLVELMVAIALGLIVLAGLIQVLIANRQAYHLQEANNYTQQNVRFALDRIGYALRMADFWGGNAAADVKIGGASVSGGAGDCANNWALVDTSNSGGGVRGYEGAGSFPISDCVEDSDYVKGSDVLVVRYADSRGIDPAAASTISAEADQVYLVSAIGQQAALFNGSNPVPTTPPAAAKGRYVYKYHAEVYYLQPCSDRTGGSDSTHCDSGDDDGSPVPTLMRLRLRSDGSLAREEVVQGIEQLQFEYGIRNSDASKPIVPEQYKNAAGVTSATEWPRVISVRVALVARGQTRDISVPHDGTFALSGDCRYEIAADGTATIDSGKCTGFSSADLGDKPQQFSRELMNQIVQVRNRIRG